MASRHFKQTKYGKVKPVKKVEEASPKPLILDLRYQYRELAKATDATAMDHVANIIRWYEDLTIWQQANAKKVPLTTAQAKLLAQASKLKREAQSSATKQLDGFIKCVEVFEKYATNIVKGIPKIKETIAARNHVVKKVQVKIEQIAPRFSKLTSLLNEMFPQTGMSIEVVPRIVAHGKDMQWKYDHELKRIFYSKARALDMVKTIRQEGILRVAIHEAYVIARAQSFYGMRDGDFISNPEACLINLKKLLNGIVDWAKKGPKPKKLIRIHKVKKIKTVKKEEVA